MKISKNFQQLRIIDDSQFPAEFTILALLIFIYLLFSLLIRWQFAKIDIWLILQLLGTLLFPALVVYVMAKSKIYIDVDANLLRIKREPFSLGNNKELPSSSIKLIYYEPSKFSFRLTKPRTEKINVIIHNIHVITKDLENIELLSGLASKEEALAIVSEISQFLKLEDNLVKIERTNPHKSNPTVTST